MNFVFIHHYYMCISFNFKYVYNNNNNNISINIISDECYIPEVEILKITSTSVTFSFSDIMYFN